MTNKKKNIIKFDSLLNFYRFKNSIYVVVGIILLIMAIIYQFLK